MRLRCPVCGAPLVLGEKVYACPQGHSFDVARQGYCNLLPVTKALQVPGDTKEQVQARRAFLSGGFYRPIADMLCRLAVPLKPNTVVDAGCGEGYYLNTLREALPRPSSWGWTSKEAVRCAAGRYKSITWLTATAADMPLFEESADLLLSLFALTAPGNFTGCWRREVIFSRSWPEKTTFSASNPSSTRSFSTRRRFPTRFAGIHPQKTETLEFTFTLEEHQMVENLLYMTPHVYRINQAGLERLRATPRLTDTAQVIFNLYCKGSPCWTN